MTNKTKINKDLLEELAKLARIEIGSNEEGMIEDFKDIVDYFNDLEKLNVSGVEPISGGTDLVNAFREDDSGDKRIDPQKALESFPEKDGDSLEVPSVFD